ncbi:MAG: ribulose-phosphate 3-epimerase [Synergistaceae bacterium]|nr:ribulose-phosphate 3-epimerase [Synergistaceae bacterium]
MKRNVLLAPSLLGADPLNISGSIESLHNNFDWLHLDIMDGHFVKNLSFGPEFARALRKRFPDSFIDTHLMIDELDVILPLFIDAGVSLITIHAETESHLLHASLSRIKSAGIKAGIALCPPTPTANIKPVLELADLILVMSVTPGFGGQKFIESSLNKVRELVSLREAHKYNYVIEIDGGINENNITSAALAGCDVIVAGSAVFRNDRPDECLSRMKENIKEAVSNFDRER